MVQQFPSVSTFRRTFTNHDDLMTSAWIRFRHEQNSVRKFVGSLEASLDDSWALFSMRPRQPKLLVISVQVGNLLRCPFREFGIQTLELNRAKFDVVMVRSNGSSCT